MKKRKLTGDQYIAELNERLQQHRNYTPGMAFCAYPEGARGGDIKGIAFAGFTLTSAHTDAIQDMQYDCEVVPTYSGFQRFVK